MQVDWKDLIWFAGLVAICFVYAAVRVWADRLPSAREKPKTVLDWIVLVLTAIVALCLFAIARHYLFK